MRNIFSLEGKIAVVTGGWGQLGQQFCCVLGAHGARVVVLDCANKPEKLLPDLSDLLEKKKAIFIKTDITQKKQIESALSQIQKEFGAPEILINNAAIDTPPSSLASSENGPFEDYPEESLDRVIDVNIKGTFFCCQVFGKAMAEKKQGSIINIASTYGLGSPIQDLYLYKSKNGKPWFKPAGYAVTKSAVLNLTRYLATYWAKQGVRVNTVTPAGIFNSQDEEFLKEYEKRIPMGRMAEPSEINGAVVYLASSASSYVTGSNLVVDGGWTAW